MRIVFRVASMAVVALAWLGAPVSQAARPIANAADSAQELWREALDLTLKGRPDEALSKYRVIVKAFPETPLAPAAQLQIGELFAAHGDYAEAFEAYQALITQFPSSDLFKPALEGQFSLVQQVLTASRQIAKARSPRPRNIPQQVEIAEMLRQILRNGRFADFSPTALYRLAVMLDEMGQAREAISEFWRFITDYPEDLRADDAAFQIGFIEYRTAREPNREQSARMRARYAFEFFLLSYPESEKSAEARHILAQLAQWDSESHRRAGKLYETSGRPEAALKSYLEALPNSSGEQETADLKKRIDRLQRQQEEREQP
jgi:outer membrane protein assembly factor BamD